MPICYIDKQASIEQKYCNQKNTTNRLTINGLKI